MTTLGLVLAQTIAVANVDVLSMNDGPAYARAQTVVIANGVITTVGPAASTPVPAGARRIDGAGRVLLPGLADMHVHLDGTPGAWMGMFLTHGVTTVLNLRGSPTHLALRARVARGELRGPTIYTSGPFVNEPQVASVSDALRAAREQQAAGYDVIKIHGPLSSAAYRVLVDSSRLAVIGHAPRNLPFDSVIAVRQPMIVHAEELIYTALSRLDTSLIGDVPARMAAARIWLTPTLTTFRGIAVQWNRPAAVDSAFALADAAPMPDGLRRYWRNANPYTGRNAPGAVWAHRAFRFQQPLVLALHRAGVRLLAGTDTPLPIMVPGASLHGELDEFVAAGLTPFEAISAATRNAGDFIVEHIDPAARVGRIAPGYRADVILVPGDPLRDVKALRRPAMVIARGAIVVGG